MRQSASDRARMLEVFIRLPVRLGVYCDYSACFGICNGINANHENGVRHFFYTVTFVNKKKVRPNGPTSSRANFFNYSLNFFPPRIARPIKPTPIRSNVDGSATDDILTSSAKAVSGRSNKPHNSNEAI
jgi:hypothetical protein